MVAMTIKEIAVAVNGRIKKATGLEKVTGVSIDSRTVAPGDMFVALKGENVDGHDYMKKAAKRGATVMLCEKEDPKVACIVVKDARQAMGKWAIAYRTRFFDLKVIGVTGSSGKTSVKEMIGTALGSSKSVMVSKGNFNNDLGLPLSLSHVNKQHRIAVLEMGMSGKGEIKALAKMASPQIGVITNIGDAHIGAFKNRKALARAKAELIMALPENGTAILNADDPMLKPWRNRVQTRTFGLATDADVRICKTGVYPSGLHVQLKSGKTTCNIRLKVLGAHHAWNAAAAIATAMVCGKSFKRACDNLEGFKPQAKMRMEIKKIGSHCIINDAYNSNPQSAAAAMKLMAELPCKGKKIALLGSMLELGDRSHAAHEELGHQVALAGVDYLIGVGKEARWIVQAARKAGLKKTQSVKNVDEAEAPLALELKQNGHLILLKGSRAIGLEKVVSFLKTKGVN